MKFASQIDDEHVPIAEVTTGARSLKCSNLTSVAVSQRRAFTPWCLDGLRCTGALIAALSTIGCASVTHDPLQAITLETVATDQRPITAADCRAANDAGTYEGTATQIKVRRSSDHLDLQCRHPEHGNADARVISRANAGLVGNVLVGGVIGAMVDQSSGAGYSYPTWIRLVFGKSLVFDKARDQPGQPQIGVEPGQQPPTKP